MTRGGSPAGSLTKKPYVLSPKVNSDNSADRKASKIQMGKSLKNSVDNLVVKNYNRNLNALRS